MSLDQWARENLSPEYQKKFFAEQERIKEECEQIDRWLYHPEEAMNLTDEQRAFLLKHEIVVSTAYIGMVRLYIGNRTIFQTSAMASVINALSPEEGIKTENYEGLSKQVHEYLNLVISALPEIQEKLLMNNMPLFGTGELDQIRAICEQQKRK